MLCADSTIILTAPEGTSYHWSTDATTRSITVSSAGLYFVTVTHAGGPDIVDTFRVTTMKINSIAGVHIPKICAGDNYQISVGHDSSCNVTFINHGITVSSSDTVFMADGGTCDCYYQLPITISGYEDTAKVNSVNDIRYLRLNLEHSAAGDLCINLICPNEQHKSNVLRMGNNNTYLYSECALQVIPNSLKGWQSDPNNDYNANTYTYFGLANRKKDYDFPCDSTKDDNKSGVGWNYCWSNSDEFSYAPGTGSLIYREENAHTHPEHPELDYLAYNWLIGNYMKHPPVFDSSDVNGGNQFYHPDESFESLIGCPLNGDWHIEVIDGLTGDNGYIFEWELAFAENLQTVGYADVDSTTVEGPWVTATSDSSFVFSPPSTLAQDTTVNYLFRFYSEYGCSFDTIIPITFLAKKFTLAGDTAVCDSIIWHGITYRPPNTLYDTLANTNGCDSILVYNLISMPPTSANITGPHYLCPDSTVQLIADNGAAYLWSNGETSQAITISEPGIYSVTVYHENGCVSESDSYQVETADNPIINAFLTDEMVAGDTLFAVMGVVEGDNLQYAAPLTTLTHNETVFLPDGVSCENYGGCSYRDTLVFSGFPDSVVLTSVNDIRYVRLKIEHSDIRDLYINLSCPDGQRSAILKKSNENSDFFGQCNALIPASDRGWQSGSLDGVFGNPNLQSGSDRCNPSASGNGPGSGWNYCWSNDTVDNYLYAPTNGSLVYQYGNTHAHHILPFKRVVDSSNVAAGRQFYHPDQSFENLIGCHLNGNWIIEVMDGMNNDNGYIFSWEISLGERLNLMQQPPVVNANCSGPWLTSITDSTFFLNPPATLAHNTTVSYLFTVTNEAGCSYDTTISITIYAHKYIDLYDTILESQLPNFTWNDSTFTGPGIKIIPLLTSHGADSIVTLHLSVKYPYDTAVCANTFPLQDWHHQTFTEADTMTVSHPVNGADSIEVLAVTSLPISIDTISVSACESFTWHGSTFDTSGVYSDTLRNAVGCDSIITLHLTINPASGSDTTATACESFTWHGSTFDTSGVYRDTVPNAAGCDSIITLNLTINHVSGSDTNAVACESFTWHGSTFDTSGVYRDTVPNTVGCDSIISLHLTIKDNSGSDTNAVACESFTWHGSTFDTSGVYRDTVTNAAGCDSIITLHLTINHVSSSDTNATACESFTWHGSTFDTSGVYRDTVPNAAGCDSIITLHLTINHVSNSDTTATACESFTWHGSTYNTSGVYRDTVPNAVGCDSIITLHLTIKHNSGSDTLATACESFTWHGSTFDTSGVYRDTVPNAVGCDSIISLHLTINHVSSSDTNVTACESFTWHGSTFDTSGVYRDTVPNAMGCDSIITLHLTINHVSNSDTTATACESFTWHGSTFDTSGVYSDTVPNAAGCDSIITLHLTIKHNNGSDTTATACESFTWHGSTFDTSGVYRDTVPNAVGCDSIIILHLTIYPIPDIHISGPTLFCGDTAILTADSASSYLWNTGDTTRQIVVTEPGLYSVTCMDTNRCQATVTHRLMSAYASPIVSVNIPGMCAGTMDTLTVGYQTSSTIILSGMGDSPDDFDTITKVTHVTMAGLWATPLPDSDSSFMLSPPDDLPNDTTVRYFFHFEDDNGCGYDTNFKINYYAHHYSRMDTTVCNAFSWNGTTYTVSDTIRLPEHNSNGCTDTLVIHLTVNYSATLEDTLQLVENDLPYHFTPTDTVFGENSPLEFQFDYTIPTEQDCDSLIHQTVIIYPNIHQSFDTMVCSLPINWHGHTFTNAGIIMDTLSSIHGSDSLVTLTLHVNDLVSSVNGITHVNCHGDSTGVVTASVTGGIPPMNYLWVDSSGSVVNTTTAADHLPAGVYIFTVTDSLGCTVSDTATVNTLHAEMVPGSIAEDQDICEGDELQNFTGTTAIGGDNSLYQWQIIFTDSTEWAVAPGIHNTQNYTFPQAVASSFALRRAWISQSCGSLFSDTVTVRFWPTYRDTITDHVCQNEPYIDNGFDLSSDETSEPGLLTREMTYPTVHCDSFVVLLLTVNPTYERIFEDEVCEGAGYTKYGFNISVAETIHADTLLRVKVLQSENGCDSTLKLHLSVVDTSIQIVSNTPDFCEEMSAELSVVTEMPDYLWSTGENTMQIAVNQPGRYSVTAYAGECSSSSTFLIESCPFQIYLPNTITPSNHDAQNDYFCLPEYYLKLINHFEISIFNRWGEQVFYSTDKHFKWNGEVKGKIYVNNIYTYVIHFTTNNEKPQLIKGTITVL
jgi:gliding motility-associated-like protein